MCTRVRIQRRKIGNDVIQKLTRKRAKTDLSTKVGSLELRSPILTAAGTAGHGSELADFMDLSQLGAVVVKSLAAYEWEGNKPLRVHQTPSGMINSVGLQGPGVQRWLEEQLPPLVDTGAAVVASIWGRSVEDYAAAAELLANAPDEVIAVEVNISCPNTESGNELFAHSVNLTSEVLTVTEACNRPRWAKLSPNVGPELVAIAEAAALAGAEAVTLVNTYFGLSIDVSTGRPHLGRGAGGVSGPAIKPLAVKAVADVRRELPELPILGVGGISSAEDVVEYAMVGANAVQVGTANFADPRICAKILQALDRWCVANSLPRFRDLIGSADLDK